MGTALSLVTILFIRPLCFFLGANESLIEYCVVYGVICLVGNIPYMLQTFFQSFFITAEKPKLGMLLTIVSGLMNMVLDWLFIAVLELSLIHILCRQRLSSVGRGGMALPGSRAEQLARELSGRKSLPCLLYTSRCV